MSSIDWEVLRKKELQPPFVPDVCAPFGHATVPCADLNHFQMKKANFDVSHELDEFMMVEKPLTHSRRKGYPDLERLKPEMRQLEEQFTVYDFSKSTRMSYYPHNQPIVAAVSHGDEEPATVLQSATNTLLPTATVVDRSAAGSPTPESERSHSATGITQRAESRAS